MFVLSQRRRNTTVFVAAASAKGSQSGSSSAMILVEFSLIQFSQKPRSLKSIKYVTSIAQGKCLVAVGVGSPPASNV